MKKPRQYTNINAEQKREHARRLAKQHKKEKSLHKWILRNSATHREWTKKVQDYHAVGVKIEAMEQK